MMMQCLQRIHFRYTEMCVDFGHYGDGVRIICNRGHEKKRTFNPNKITSGQDFIKIILLFFFS